MSITVSQVEDEPLAAPGTRCVSPTPAGDSYLSNPRGVLSWAFTLDHKRIGVMYLVAILSSFLLGGLFAILIRAELWTAGPTLISADTYNRAFTLHGSIMVFLVIIPSIPAAFGNFVLPLMLGAKDLAFPRLNLTSLYLYAIGAFLCVQAMIAGGLDTGWTFYVPYSTDATGAVSLVLFGAFILGFSSILTGVNFIASIHQLRPPGMGWFRMPLMLWAICVEHHPGVSDSNSGSYAAAAVGRAFCRDRHLSS